MTRRALPQMGLAAPAVSPAASLPDVPDIEAGAPTLTGTVQLFDPAMCCDTGVCGPTVDPTLLAAARDVRWLSARGVQVARYNLGQEPMAFVHFAPVQALLTERGVEALPATWVNGTLLTTGRHASRDELVAALTASATA